MSIKTVNALSHYTDWTIGHVHAGALGWVAFISIGNLYYLIPRLYGQTQMASVQLITVHFWVATLGVVLYISAMWIAGVTRGLMWRAVNVDGTLTYSFVERERDLPVLRSACAGGVLFLAGMLIMAYNVWKTVAGKQPIDAPIPQVLRLRQPRRLTPARRAQHETVARHHRNKHRLDDRVDHPGRERGGTGRNRPPVLPALDDGAGRGLKTLCATATGGTRHLYP